MNAIKDNVKKMMKSVATPNIGDKVYYSNADGYNHGCSNYAILKVTATSGDGITGEVIDANSCNSCWQVGHDNDYVFATVGDVISFKFDEIANASVNNVHSVKWEVV